MQITMTNETYNNKLHHGEITKIIRKFISEDKTCLNIDCDSCEEAKQVYANIQTFRRRANLMDVIKVHLSTDTITIYKIKNET